MTLHRQFVVLACLCITLLATTIIYLQFFERPLLSYKNLPFKVLGPARPGESVLIVVERCNASSELLDYELSHWILNADTSEPATVLPPGPVPSLPPGCHPPTTSAANVVPIGKPPGCNYIVGGDGLVKGTLRTFRVPWRSQPFCVLADEGKRP